MNGIYSSFAPFNKNLLNFLALATPHQPRYAQQLFNYGMIAPGNHHFERFAALCNTPGGSQGGCAAGGRLRASPTRAEQFKPPVKFFTPPG
jgi:hypothetical protein